MNRPRSRLGRMWELYRTGGVPPMLAAVTNLQNAQQMAFIRSMARERRDREELHVPLKQLEAVVIDLETTGFSPNHGDEILSFGAVRMKGGEIADPEWFDSLVKVSREVPAHIVELTGITAEMAAGAPGLLEALRGFLDFAGRRVMIMHGSGHDKAFLNAALWKTSRTRLSHRVLDTMHLAKWLYPEWKRHDLDRMLDCFAIPVARRHNALEDAKATARLWAALQDEIMRRCGALTLYELYTQITV